MADLPPPAEIQHDPLAHIDLDAYRQALSAVESNNNPKAIGLRGERGLFQIRPTTWALFTTKSFHLAFDPDTSWETCRRILTSYAQQLHDARHPVTPYYLALAYNSGPTAVTIHRTSNASQNFADRVRNLYNFHHRTKQTPSNPTPILPPSDHR